MIRSGGEDEVVIGELADVVGHGQAEVFLDGYEVELVAADTPCALAEEDAVAGFHFAPCAVGIVLDIAAIQVASIGKAAHSGKGVFHVFG